MRGKWTAPGKKPPEDSMLPFKVIVGIARVQTLCDGSYRVWLDIGEDNTPEAAKLLTLRKEVLEVEFIKRVR